VGDYAGLFPRSLKLLFFDVETAPMLAFIWRLRTEYVGTHMLEHDTFLLSWAAKWSDETKLHSGVLTPSEAKGQDDSRIVKSLSQMMRQADYVVAHNGDRFDLPMVNGRLLLNGLEPVQVQTIDTLKLARSSFRLASNKLDYLAKTLGFAGKHDTGFDLWRSCYQGHGPSLKRMVEYNRNDVVLLEQVFGALKPYVKNLPRLVDAGEWRQDVCPSCGSDRRTKDGFHRTKVNTFQRFKCSDCKRHYRAWQAVGSKKVGTVGL